MTFLFLKNEHPVVPTLKIYEFVPKVVKALSPFHTNHGRPNTMKVTAHIINFNKLHYASCFWVKFSSSTFPCAGVSVCSWNQNSTPNESESALERVNMRLRWVSPLLARPQIEDFSPPPPSLPRQVRQPVSRAEFSPDFRDRETHMGFRLTLPSSLRCSSWPRKKLWFFNYSSWTCQRLFKTCTIHSAVVLNSVMEMS